jgi:hypothetical protein
MYKIDIKKGQNNKPSYKKIWLQLNKETNFQTIQTPSNKPLIGASNRQTLKITQTPNL